MFTQYTLPLVMTVAAVIGNLAVQTDQGVSSASDNRSTQSCCLMPSDCCFDDSECCTPAREAQSNASVTATVVTQLMPTAVDSNDSAQICCLKHAYCCSVKATCCRQ